MPLSKRILPHGKKSILKNASGSNVSSLALDGNTLQLNQTNNQPQRSVDLSSIGGGGSPGGQNTYIQYNNAGNFGGVAAMAYDSTDEKLVLTSSVAGKFSLKLKNNNNSSVVNGLLIADDADGSRLAITHSNVDNENNIWGYENIPMKFATNNTERMRILGGGNVGIGVTSPGAKLDVDGNLRVRDSHTLAAGDSDDLFLYHDGNSTLRSDTGIFNIVQNTAENLNITANGGDVVIDSNIYNMHSGKVGIGNSSPNYNVDVLDNAADHNYVGVTNTSAGTSSVAGFRLQSQTTDGLFVGHADNRTVSRYGITVAGYTEILTTAGNGLIIGNSHNAPIVFGTNNAEQLRIADNLITLGDGVVLAPHSSDDFTIDSPNDIVLDYAGNNLVFKSDGTTFGKINNNNAYWDFDGNAGDSYLRFIPWNGGAGTTAYTYWGDGTHNQVIYVRGTDSINTNSTTIANTFIQQYDGAGNSDTFIQAGGDSYFINQLGLGTNNPSEQLQLQGDSTYLSILAADGSEGVRLGTASSGRGLLYLKTSTGGNSIYLDAAGDSYINNGSDLGIGTTSPNAKLDVLGTSNPQIRASYNGSNYLDIYASNGTGYIKQDGRFRASSSTARYFFYGNASSTGRTEMFITAGGDIANRRISSFAYLLRGYQGADGAGIYFGNVVSGSNNEGNTSASGREGTQWYAGLNYAGGGATDEWILGTDYRTTSGSGADGYTPVITAQKSGAYGPEGKVGINTVNPAATFDIRQRTDNHGLIVDTDYSNGDQIRVLKDGNTNLLGKVTFDGTNMVVGAWGTGGGIRFWNQTEGMRLTGGKLGIGTTGPWQQLHLTEDMLVQGGTIYFGNSDKVKLKRGGTNYFEMLTSGNSAAGLRSLGLLVSNTYGSTPQRGTVTFQGLAAANKPTAASGYGFLWVSGTSAEKLYFTEGDGTQHDLTAGGGGGGIGGSIANTQIAYGNGTDIAGSASLTYTSAGGISLLQGADEAGVVISGYDDKSSDWLKLHVKSDGNARVRAAVSLQNQAAESIYLSAGEHLYLDNGTRNTYSTIFRDGTGEYARFKNARLGIGTTEPSYKLDVYGDANVTGSLHLGDADTKLFRTSNDLYIRAHTDILLNDTGGAVGIGLADPSVTRQSEGLTISGTSITSTTYTSSTHKKVTSLFVPSLGSGSYILAGIGGRNSQMGDGRAEPPLMVIGDVGTSLHQTTMNSGRAVSLVLAGTAGYNSGGQDFGNFGSLLFHGNSNWSGNARRWLISNAFRNSGAGDMGLGFASETSASLDPTVSGSTPSVVMSTDSNYGVAGKGGLIVGNKTHIGGGLITSVSSTNPQLSLAYDGSNYNIFKTTGDGSLEIKRNGTAASDRIALLSGTNILIGQYAGYDIDSTQTGETVIIGDKAGFELKGNETHGRHTIIGAQAAYTVSGTTDSDYIIALGAYAAYGAQPTKGFTAIGAFSGYYLTGSGDAPILIGGGAGKGAALGAWSTSNGITMNEDVLIGQGGVAEYAEVLSQNTIVGSRAAGYLRTGTQNVAIGRFALRNASGSNGVTGNVTIGQSAGAGIGQFNKTNGSRYNIAIGYETQEKNLVGDRNIAIGYKVGIDGADTADDILRIGNAAGDYSFIRGDMANNNLWIGAGTPKFTLSGGNVGIGTIAPSAKLHVDGDIRIDNGHTLDFDARGYIDVNVDGATGEDEFFFRRRGSSNEVKLDMSTAGAPKLGIGTTSPARTLEVKGNGAYMAFNSTATDNHQFTIGSDNSGFIVYDDTLSTYRFVIDQDSGNVGIGTTSPQQPLHVLTSANDKGILIDVSDDTHEGRLLFGDTSSNAVGHIGYNHSLEAMRFFVNSTEQLRITDNVITLGDGVVLAPDASDNFTIDSPNGIVLDGTSAANGVQYHDGGLEIMRISNSSSNPVIRTMVDAKDMIFQQFDGTEVMRITDGQKVGIGQDTPTAKFEVMSATNSYEQARFQWDASNYLGVFVNSGGDSQLEAKTGHLTLKTDTSAHNIRVDSKGDFRVDLGDSNGGYNTRIRAADSSPVFMAKSNGLIGIGTESPDDLLHVLGGDVDPSIKLQNNRSGHNGYYLMEHRGSTLKLQSTGSAVVPIRFTIQNSDIMRIDDTGLGIGTDAPSSSLHVSGGAIQKDIGESVYLRSIVAGFDSNAILQHQPNTQYVKAEATSPPGTGAIPTELPLAESKYTGLEITVMQRWDADPEGALTVQKQAGSSDVIYEGGSNSASATVSIAAYRGANKTFVIAAAGVWVVKD